MPTDLRSALKQLAPNPPCVVDAPGLVAKGLRRRRHRMYLRGAGVALAAVALTPAALWVHGANGQGDTLDQATAAAPAAEDGRGDPPACSLPRSDADLAERKRTASTTPRNEPPEYAKWLEPEAAQDALRDLAARFDGRQAVVGSYLDFRAEQLVIVVDPGTDATAVEAEAQAVSRRRVGVRAIAGCRSRAEIDHDLRRLQADPTLRSMAGAAISVDAPTGMVSVGVHPDDRARAEALPVIRETGARVTSGVATPF